jgi:hypothetical protein
MGLPEVALSEINFPSHWKLMAAGILNIVSVGTCSPLIALILLIVIGDYALPEYVFFILISWIVINSLIALVGGIIALQRKNWRLSLVGSIGLLLTGNLIFGGISTYFVWLSRKEFE